MAGIQKRFGCLPGWRMGCGHKLLLGVRPNYLLAMELTNEFYLRLILSGSGIHASLLIAAFDVVAVQNRLFADEHSAAASSTRVIAASISAYPGADGIRTGTADLAAKVHRLLL